MLAKYTQPMSKQTTTHKLGLETGQRPNYKEAPEAIKVKEKLFAQYLCEQNQIRLKVPTN